MERTARELVLGVVQQHTHTGISIVVEGAPGIGKTFLARAILDSIAPGQAKVLRVAGERGRRNDPFAAVRPLAGSMSAGNGDPGGRRSTGSTSCVPAARSCCTSMARTTSTRPR